jgi:hypothetical protein
MRRMILLAVAAMSIAAVPAEHAAAQSRPLPPPASIAPPVPMTPGERLIPEPLPAEPGAPGAGAPNAAPAEVAAPPVNPALQVQWEVKSRFRLFRSEKDFRTIVAADRGDGVLAAEARLAQATDGRGWAQDMVARLCVDAAGTLVETCDRDGEKENYLSPQDHRVGVLLSGPLTAGSTCDWSFADGLNVPQQARVPCEEEVRLRVRFGVPTIATVDVTATDGSRQRGSGTIQVRDLLIAGLGDSIAAGEGNPDRPVKLSDDGFCFRRFLGGTLSEYYRPGRAGFAGNKSCAVAGADTTITTAWNRQGARWMSAGCHRSLYGYQLRTALAIAVENPQVAVTFLPLACSGATIDTGLFNAQASRECPLTARGGNCAGKSPAQLTALKAMLTKTARAQPARGLDLMLLTVGANDILFSSLVADVIVDAGTERVLFNRGGQFATAADSQRILAGELPGNFAKLRTALKPLVGGNLARVVYVSYGNPALAGPSSACPGGRDGFDVHPAFGVDATRLRSVAEFVSGQFLPRMQALARCEGGILCRDPNTETMNFVDSHQTAFANHGFCARAETDPAFDRECISTKGETFNADPVSAVSDPLTCGAAASEYRPYASRARWVRTADDSYFTAMTYPEGVSGSMQPSDIHDATWGVLSAVYGGAIHPTAQGHAAMADAAMPAARHVLELSAPAAVTAEPLPPPGALSR